MAANRVSQLPVELLASGSAKLRVSQVAVEVLASITPAFTWSNQARTDVSWLPGTISNTWACQGRTAVSFVGSITGFWDCDGRTQVSFGASFPFLRSGFEAAGATTVTFGAALTLSPGAWTCNGRTDVTWMGKTDGAPQGCLTGDGIYDGVVGGETNFVF